MNNLFPANKGFAQKVAKSLDKTKEYKMSDITKIMSDNKETYQGPTNMLAIATELKKMGFKINESFVLTLEEYLND